MGFYYGSGLSCVLRYGDRELDGNCLGVGFEIIELDNQTHSEFVVFQGDEVWTETLNHTHTSYNTWEKAEIEFFQSDCGTSAFIKMDEGEYFLDYDIRLDLNRASQTGAKAVFFGMTTNSSDAEHMVRNIAVNSTIDATATPTTALADATTVTVASSKKSSSWVTSTTSNSAAWASASFDESSDNGLSNPFFGNGNNIRTFHQPEERPASSSSRWWRWRPSAAYLDRALGYLGGGMFLGAALVLAKRAAQAAGLGGGGAAGPRRSEYAPL